MKLKPNSGQVLIESIVAISIGIVGLLGFLHLLTQAVTINKNVGQQFVATYLAAEGIEVVKGLIDANYVNERAWNDGFSSDGSYEIQYDDTALRSTTGNKLYYHPLTGIYDYSSTGALQTQFQRTVRYENLRSGQELKIVSVVEWATRDDIEEVKLESHFFDWRWRP